MKKQTRIGLTGSIGAGKTTVSKIFEENGIPIFNSDWCASEGAKDPSIIDGYKSILGDEIYVNNELDRVSLREIIFKDKAKLKQVNELITPYVKNKFNEFCLKHADKKIVMLESAILFEINAVDGFDFIITVTATEKTRIERVLKRDNANLDIIMAKIANQLPELTKIAKSDYVVINDGYDLIDSLDLLEKQVLTILDSINFKTNIL